MTNKITKLMLNGEEYEIREYQSGWAPGANTLGYYTMDNNITNQSSGVFPDGIINDATFSTTRVHGNNTYSLYCDGSTYAYLPADSAFEFGTNDFTISCRVYSETDSGNQTGIISNYGGSGVFSNMAKGYRISDRFSNSNELNFCWAVADSGGNRVAWYDGTTNTSIYNDGWHNIVVTRESGTLNVYLDGNTAPVITDTTYSAYEIGRNNNICFGYNVADIGYSKVYLNDVIFENVAWTTQQISDYYTLTNV